MDPGEACDDGNKTPGDGCSAICQIPAGWSCTGTPSVCNMAGVCGDGILGASEACDDMNTTGGDGCSADCKKVETGYECRVPGRSVRSRVRRRHGHRRRGVRRRQHDGGRRLLPDCAVEPGATCDNTMMPSKCIAAVCGNKKVEAGECVRRG